ncbi:MAG: uroporphyrinogen decarboxylase family protein [Phycisphaeraceae bacterium]
MNWQKNFHRLMTGHDEARVPLDLPVTPPVVDRIAQHYGTRDAVSAFDLGFRGVGIDWLVGGGDRRAWLDAYACLGVTMPVNVELNCFGIAHLPPPAASVGEAYHFREMLHPLASITDVEQLVALPWPDIERAAGDPGLGQRVAAVHREGRVAVLGLECTAFESTWYLRGMDNVFVDLIEDTGISQWLLDWFTRRSIAAAIAGVHAGVDVVGLGDDIGTQRGMMMAPEFWRQHLKPRLAQVIAAVREHERGQRVYVRYHSDGDVRAVIDDLIEVGVDILNPLQPECMPHDEVIPRYRDHLAFWGLIGTQTTMPFGTPDDVRSAVDRCRRHVRDGARIVIAPTHVLEPDVPWSNITALVDHVIGLPTKATP